MARTTINLAIVVVVAAYLWHRIRVVGPYAAIAELVGLGGVYEMWEHSYHPLHRTLFGRQHAADWLDASLLSAMTQDNATRRESILELAQHHGHGIYSLPFLREDAARRLGQETANFVKQGHLSASPNSMNDYGVVLSPDGLDGLDGMLDVVYEAFATLNAALYAVDSPAVDTSEAAASAASAARADGCCAAHHAFVVQYNASEQRGLDMHHDASDVTLNVCLEQDDAVATLSSRLNFCGFVGDASHRKRTISYRHSVGRAVIHLGAHRHGATDILAGTRQNLIVWGQSSRKQPGSSSNEPRRGGMRLHPDESPPDLDCLSWTHDADYEEHRELPPVALAARERKRAQAHLFDLASRATDEHISKLPDDYQPLVRMLRQMQRDQQVVGS